MNLEHDVALFRFVSLGQLDRRVGVALLVVEILQSPGGFFIGDRVIAVR
jgi:hypothetical protein